MARWNAYYLIKHVGPKVAMEIAASGRALKAEEAKRLGLINTICESGVLKKEALAWAEELAQGPTLAIARAKKLIQTAQDESFEHVIEQERNGIIRSSMTEDFKEGVLAFREKRTAKFTGK